ncbi:MAG: M24 family metallopeptidase [Gemmatimonas sp.]
MPLKPRLNAPAPKLPERLVGLLHQETPRFSAAEMKRRRDVFAAALAKAGCDHALLIGGDRRGSALQWLCGWPANTDNYLVVTPGKQDVLYVRYPNHQPQAQVIAPEADVRWGAKGGGALAIDELIGRGAKGKTVGVIGQFGLGYFEKLSESGFKLKDVNRVYTQLRMIKSEEEFEWTRIGAALSDAGLDGLARNLRVGMNEHELAAIIEQAYVPWGGLTGIHHLGVTSMAKPDCCVPSQFPRNRTVQKGDMVFTEISSLFWSYSGQVLRSFTVEAEPTPLYKDLYACADAVYHAVLKVLKPGNTPKDVLDAASPIIREAGFTVCDDLVHGYIGGYLPPVLGTHERPSGPVPEFAFEPGMAMVVQPSIVTKDSNAGVQTGELVRITATGAESLHNAPWGFRRIGE